MPFDSFDSTEVDSPCGNSPSKNGKIAGWIDNATPLEADTIKLLLRSPLSSRVLQKMFEEHGRRCGRTTINDWRKKNASEHPPLTAAEFRESLKELHDV